MKIRLGFVSNSSSSSFCVLGYETSQEELMKVFGIKKEENKEYWEYIEVIEEAANERGYDAVMSGEDHYCAYIGFDIQGLPIDKILELGCQPNDDDTSIAGLRRLMDRSKDPVVRAGEIAT